MQNMNEAVNIILYPNSEKILKKEIRVNGLLNGEQITYFPDGNIMYIENYKNDVKDGITKAFFPISKILKKSIPYENGEVHGTIHVFSPDGELLKKLSYENGKRLGNNWIYL